MFSEIVALVPIIILASFPLFWFTWKLKRTVLAKNEDKRSPFSEKLLRPPGESLRLKIDELRGDISNVNLDIFPILWLPTITYAILNRTNLWICAIGTVVACVVSYILAKKKIEELTELRNELKNHRLGFDGERVVASELAPLAAKGYQVFHDFIVDTKPGGEATNFNIDHIAVGPAGIFVIETKAKRKSKNGNRARNEEYQLSFDGKVIRFPDGSYTTDPIDQAKRNAKELQKWLGGSQTHGIDFRPVVVYPGWYVKEGLDSGVQPASRLADRIPNLKRSKFRELTPEEVSIFSKQIENKCRNIEGSD